jgi:hypothetical protein
MKKYINLTQVRTDLSKGNLQWTQIQKPKNDKLLKDIIKNNEPIIILREFPIK